MKQAFINRAFHSLFCAPKNLATDPFGRFVVLVLLIDKLPYTFVAIYVPPPFTITMWEGLMVKVLQVAKVPIILAGDLCAFS